MSKTIVKMDDLKERLSKYKYLLFNYQRKWKVATKPDEENAELDYFTCKQVYLGETKREIEIWLDGYETAVRDNTTW